MPSIFSPDMMAAAEDSAAHTVVPFSLALSRTTRDCQAKRRSASRPGFTTTRNPVAETSEELSAFSPTKLNGYDNAVTDTDERREV